MSRREEIEERLQAARSVHPRHFVEAMNSLALSSPEWKEFASRASSDTFYLLELLRECDKELHRIARIRELASWETNQKTLVRIAPPLVSEDYRSGFNAAMRAVMEEIDA